MRSYNNKTSIAFHLGVHTSAILSIASWVSVFYVHIKGIGFRFVSKAVINKLVRDINTQPTTVEPIESRELDLPREYAVSFARFAYDCKHGTRQQHGYLNDNNCTFDRMEGMTMLATMPTGELIDISPSAVYISLHFNSNKEYNAHYFGK